MTYERDRWAEIDALFHGALSLPRDDRAAFLRSRAGADESLAAEVQTLLDAHTGSHALLDAPLPANLPHGMRLGPYALERVIGTGGMSTVYLARRADRQFDKDVAIKLVNQGLASEIEGGQFHTERHVLARLEHGNIARLLDAGVSEFGQPYLVMEWVDGVTLDEWVRREQPDLARKLELWLELAAAVAYAHRNLVIHRDLKPSNVLVGADGTAKLVDFGIAKLLEGPRADTLTKTARYTPRYASPEQLRGEPATTFTDVFGMGLLLFELVAGPQAVDLGTTAHLGQRQRNDPTMPSTVPADLAAVVRMATRDEPERRYAGVAELAADVRRFQRGFPVLAQPDSWAYQVRKFVVRHRMGVAAAGVVVAVVVGAAGLLARQVRLTANERDRANVEARKALQINRFLQSTLAAADPSREGRDVRVADVLDRAGERLGTELGGEPEVHAELRSTLASTYQGLGLLDAAVAQARHALELRERLHPSGHSDVANSSIALGHVLYERGDFPEALALLERGVAAFERLGLGASLEAAGGRRNLGEVLHEIGRFADAERQYRDAIALYRRLLSRDDERVAAALNDLAVLLGGRGDFAAAEPLHREALAIIRRVRGPDHLEVAQTLHNVAGVLDGQGRYDEAEPLYRQALTIELAKLGDQHNRIVLTRTSLANLFWMKRDYASAEVFARQALGSAAQVLHADHPLTAYAHIVLGQTLTDAGRALAGEPHLRAALAIRTKLLSETHWLVANTQSVLGGCLASQRRYQEAMPLLRTSYEKLLADRGPDHEKTRDARRRLSELYRAVGRPDDALQPGLP